MYQCTPGRDSSGRLLPLRPRNSLQSSVLNAVNRGRGPAGKSRSALASVHGLGTNNIEHTRYHNIFGKNKSKTFAPWVAGLDAEFIVGSAPVRQCVCECACVDEDVRQLAFQSWMYLNVHASVYMSQRVGARMCICVCACVYPGRQRPQKVPICTTET